MFAINSGFVIGLLGLVICLLVLAVVGILEVRMLPLKHYIRNHDTCSPTFCQVAAEEFDWAEYESLAEEALRVQKKRMDREIEYYDFDIHWNNENRK